MPRCATRRPTLFSLLLRELLERADQQWAFDALQRLRPLPWIGSCLRGIGLEGA